MAVLNIYDINAKANELSEEFRKLDEPADNDKSAILYEEMRILAFNNRTRFKL